MEEKRRYQILQHIKRRRFNKTNNIPAPLLVLLIFGAQVGVLCFLRAQFFYDYYVWKKQTTLSALNLLRAVCKNVDYSSNKWQWWHGGQFGHGAGKFNAVYHLD